jgi:hypothetical protein
MKQWSISFPFLAIATLALPGSLHAEDTKLTEGQFLNLMRKYQLPVFEHALLRPIIDAEKEDDDARVVQLSNQLLERPLSFFDSSQYGMAIKSMAYMHRARARAKLSGDDIGIFLEDSEQSAKLGNLQAMEDLIKVFLEDLSGKSPIGQGYGSSAEKLEYYVRRAAPLADPLSALLLGSGKVGELADDERAFWLFLGIMRETLPQEKKLAMIKQLIEERGEQLEQGIARYGLSTKLNRDPNLGLPGRNATNTMFVESDLRATFQKLLGIIRVSGTPPEAPTLKEFWQIYQYLYDNGFGSPFLLMPGNKSSNDGHIAVRSRDTVVSAISAGDRVLVRCGPLSHVAVVYRVDRTENTFLFTDAAYRFWQGETNACVSSLKLVYTDAARPLASVSIDEVRPILDGVITVRDEN